MLHGDTFCYGWNTMSNIFLLFSFQVQTVKLTLSSHLNASTPGFWFEKERCVSQCVECAESKSYTQLNIPLYSHGLVCLGHSQSFLVSAFCTKLPSSVLQCTKEKINFPSFFTRCSSLHGSDYCCNCTCFAMWRFMWVPIFALAQSYKLSYMHLLM